MKSLHTHPKLSFLCRSTMLQLAFYDAVTLNSTLHPPNIKLNWFERHKSTSQNYFSSQRQKKKIPFRETHILTENWALCSHRNSSFTNLWSKALKTRRDKKKKNLNLNSLSNLTHTCPPPAESEMETCSMHSAGWSEPLRPGSANLCPAPLPRVHCFRLQSTV